MATPRKKTAAKRGTSNVPATMADMEDRLAQAAKEQYDKEPGGVGNWIGIRGNEFKLNGEDLGDLLTVVIVADAYEHAYYDSAFNKDDPLPPACFALAEMEDDLGLHDSSPAPQCDTGMCADCEWNEFGSSDTGRGKACKNSRRLALLAVETDEDGNPTGVAFGEMPHLRIPPTSLGNYRGYIKRSNKVTRRPAWAYVTEIGFDPDAEYETLTFRLVAPIDNPEEINQIDELRAGALEALLEPFDVSGYKSPEEVKAARRGGGGGKRTSAATAGRTTTKKKVAKKTAARGRSKMS